MIKINKTLIKALQFSCALSLSAPFAAQAVPLVDGLGGVAGYGEYAMQNTDGSFRRNDDGSSNQLALNFDVNFFGSTYNTFFGYKMF